jgi:hypothetical protein
MFNAHAVFGIFIFSSVRNNSDLIVLLSHHFSTLFSATIEALHYVSGSFVVYPYKSVSSVIVCHFTAVATVQSSITFVDISALETDDNSSVVNS